MQRECSQVLQAKILPFVIHPSVDIEHNDIPTRSNNDGQAQKSSASEEEIDSAYPPPLLRLSRPPVRVRLHPTLVYGHHLRPHVFGWEFVELVGRNAEAEGAMQRTQDVGHGDERVGQVELRGEDDDGIWEEVRGYVQTG